MNANDEIHALRCDRASLLREASYHQQELDALLARLRETEAERDELAKLVDYVVEQFDHLENLEEPTPGYSARQWVAKAKEIRGGKK